MKNKWIWITLGTLVAGSATFFYIKYRNYKKKYQVIKDRSFDIIVKKPE